MPNLRTRHVSILGSIETNDHNNQNNEYNCLTNLTIRIGNFISLEKLISLFIQNGLNIKNLIIYLNRVKENSSEHKAPHIDKLYQRITTIMNEL